MSRKFCILCNVCREKRRQLISGCQGMRYLVYTDNCKGRTLVSLQFQPRFPIKKKESGRCRASGDHQCLAQMPTLESETTEGMHNRQFLAPIVSVTESNVFFPTPPSSEATIIPQLSVLCDRSSTHSLSGCLVGQVSLATTVEAASDFQESLFLLLTSVHLRRHYGVYASSTLYTACLLRRFL